MVFDKVVAVCYGEGVSAIFAGMAVETIAPRRDWGVSIRFLRYAPDRSKIAPASRS